jgi:type II secretory pathway component PulM
VAAALAAAGAAETVSGGAALAQSVSALLADQRLRAERAAAAARVAAAGLGILDAVLKQLAPWLDRVAPVRGLAPSPSWVRA